VASDHQNERNDAAHFIHVDYLPSSGWVLTIMSRLLNSSDPRLRKAFEQWSETPLKELGIAITTRMHMLGLAVRRLNARVAALRAEIAADPSQLDAAIWDGYVFRLKDHDLAYELLIDMDSFIFETRSLYEIVGKFLVALFDVLFGREITENNLQSILANRGIDTRWITELRENRKLFFHQTAPWLAVQVDHTKTDFNPVLLKTAAMTFENPDDRLDFDTLHAIYYGFVNSITQLNLFIMEQIRILESQTKAGP
jgi:hypothetical protein